MIRFTGLVVLLLLVLLLGACGSEEQLDFSEPTYTPVPSNGPAKPAAVDAERLTELYRKSGSAKLAVWWVRDRERGVDCWVATDGAGVGITCLELTP